MLVGGATAGVGALAVAGGAVAGAMALGKDGVATDKANTPQAEAPDAFRERDELALTANLLYGVGAGLVAVGGALAAIELMKPAEDAE
jgi:hypothetical protein